MITGSADGICEDCILEIKCPTTAKTYVNYIKDGKPSEKYTQVKIQMYWFKMKN